MERTQRILLAEVKRALACLYDPIFLRKHPLTRLLPPSYLALAAGDTGKALQQLLHESIEQIKPAGTRSSTDRKWRPYNLLSYRYVEGMSPRETAQQMGVCEREIQRVQRKALQALVECIENRVKAQSPLVGSEPIPRTRNFVGRTSELASYGRRLEQDRLVVITGMPGAGKTALGAELAGRWSERSDVLWITFQPGKNTGLETLLESVALALASLGRDDYWYFLRAGQAETAFPAGEARIVYLLSLLSQGNYLVCFDNYHLVSEDKEINALLSRLWENGRKGSLALLIMSRVMPAFASGLFFDPLEGLSREDTRALLDQVRLSTLPGKLLTELHQQTQGIPVFVEFFVSWVRSRGLEGAAEATAPFIRRMASQPDVKGYLLHQVHEALSAPEQRFLTAASAIRTAFKLEEEPLADLLPAQDAERIEATVLSLVHKHVLVYLEEGKFAIPRPVREYFYSCLKDHPADKGRVHRQLAHYYQTIGNLIESAYHYGEVQEYGALARLLSENIDRLIDTGLGEEAFQQLNRLTAEQVQDRLLYQDVCLALGKLYEIRGQHEQALKRYEVALVAGGPPEQLARIYREIGNVYMNRSEYSAALAHFQQGMALWEDGSETVPVALLRYSAAMAELYRGNSQQALLFGQSSLAILARAGLYQELGEAYQVIGLIYQRLGNYAQALDYCQKSLTLQREIGHTRGIAASLREQGAVKVRQGCYAEASGYFDEGMKLYRRVRDLGGITFCLNALGTVDLLQGNYSRAARRFQRATTLMGWLGDVRGTAVTLSNLGIIYKRSGRYTRARKYYERSLALCRQIDYIPGVVAAFINLGTIYYCQGNWAKAREYGEQGLTLAAAIEGAYEAALLHTLLGLIHCAQGNPRAALEQLEEAVRLQKESASQGTLADAYRALAESYLLLHEVDRATAYGKQAAQVAVEASSRKEEGEAYRVLGECWRARGDASQAESYFQQSIALLNELGAPFELGQAYSAFGSFLQENGRVQEAINFLQRAEAIFRRIGAKEELRRVQLPTLASG